MKAKNVAVGFSCFGILGLLIFGTIKLIKWLTSIKFDFVNIWFGLICLLGLATFVLLCDLIGSFILNKNKKSV